MYIKDHHEGIIDRDLWDRTQEELRRRSPSEEQKSRHSNRYWCSGKIRCGECGYRFVSRTRKLQSGKYRAWWCFQKSRHGGRKILDGQKVGCSNRSINERALFTCMKYCIDLLCNNKGKIRKEVLTDIQNVCNAPEETMDLAKVKQKMDAIEEKKRKSFDAMLEGMLSKEDLQKQTEWYDKELAHLQHMIAQSRKNDAFYNMGQKKMEQFEKSLDEILSFGDQNDMLYREILEKIVVYREEERGCNRLVVWLKSLPFGIQLRIRSTGSGENFRTEILETEFVAQDCT